MNRIHTENHYGLKYLIEGLKSAKAKDVQKAIDYYEKTIYEECLLIRDPANGWPPSILYLPVFFNPVKLPKD